MLSIRKLIKDAQKKYEKEFGEKYEEKRLKSIEELIKEKRAIIALSEWLFPDTEFETAHTDIAKKYTKPSNCKKIIAEFNHNKKHWIIYVKKDKNL